MNGLRLHLREITENGAPETHPQLIEELAGVNPNGIELLASAEPINSYTCGMHALDLVGDPQYEIIVMASPHHVFASPQFIQRLIDRGVLQPVNQPQEGGLVVYRNSGAVRHIGKLVAVDRVESKWGIGHLYRHGLLEVPSHYGDDLLFFASCAVDDTLDELVEFAKENGVEFEGDN